MASLASLASPGMVTAGRLPGGAISVIHAGGICKDECETVGPEVETDYSNAIRTRGEYVFRIRNGLLDVIVYLQAL